MEKAIKAAFENDVITFKETFKSAMKDEYAIKREDLRKELGQTLTGK